MSGCSTTVRIRSSVAPCGGRPTRAWYSRRSWSRSEPCHSDTLKTESDPMLNRSKLAAVALLAAVFLAGGLAGWGGHEAADRDERGGRGHRGPDAMVAYLGRELDLTPAQRYSVRAIFTRHRPETDALWARVRPQFDSIKTRMRAEIDAQLTPEQRARHQRLIEKAEHHRREREDSTKGKTGGGRNSWA